MIHLDGIVFSLQRYGGISVYFRALVEQALKSGDPIALGLPEGQLIGTPPGGPDLIVHSQPRRLLERYRDYPCQAPIGHSSYYRLPEPGVKSVVTVYDFTYERYFTYRQKLIHSWQKNRAIRAADAVICISESTRNDLFRFLPDTPRHKVHVVHLGINAAFLGQQGAALASPSATRQPYFLYVGARSTYKNFRPVLEALHGRPEYLVCVGGGDFTSEEKANIAHFCPGRVDHIPWADDQTLASLYRQAIALVFPSLYEGFGIPVAEAMASACPVIAANTSSIPEVAGSAACLLESVNSDTLRVAFDQVQQAAYRADLIEAGVDRAKAFAWDKCALSTRNIYSALYSQHCAHF